MRAPPPLTADQLLHVHIPHKVTELVRGALVVREPAGARHGDVAMNVAHALKQFVDARRLGRVFAAETGFKLFSEPDTVRAADAAFVATTRLPASLPLGYLELAPDLAVEVLSPNDRPGEVLAKVADWVTAGTTLVWVIDPACHAARVYRADGRETHLDVAGKLDGESVLPGFTAALAGLF
jgi:Uma2 family endonuclease